MKKYFLLFILFLPAFSLYGQDFLGAGRDSFLAWFGNHPRYELIADTEEAEGGNRLEKIRDRETGLVSLYGFDEAGICVTHMSVFPVDMVKWPFLALFLDMTYIGADELQWIYRKNGTDYRVMVGMDEDNYYLWRVLPDLVPAEEDK